jgi:hypothetical protein
MCEKADAKCQEILDDLVSQAYVKSYTDMLIYGTGVIVADGEQFYSKSIKDMLAEEEKDEG